MAGDSAKRILDRLKDSGLLTGAQLPTVDSIADSGNDTDANISERLVERGLLTPHQADRLLANDGESLLIAERYEIREKLGSGGMGDVYLARDRQLDRDVAVKVLPQRLVRDEDAVARFQREAKAMARLSHPNIVQAHDAGSDGERHFLVMEYVAGANLSEWLKQHEAIDPSIAADYAYQVAIGLEHAHGKGLIHRDLKPSNLLVAVPALGKGGLGGVSPNSKSAANAEATPPGPPLPRGGDSAIKILDLGLAKFAQDQIDDESITLAGAGLGTPDYMAPEQFRDAKNADERSDVYSLGCTLYRMLAGRVPFPGSSLSEKQRQHQQTEPEPITRPGVPAGLAQAVYKMMAKRPADRFQTARECAEALTPYVDVSSASLPNLNATVDWEGSVMTIVPAKVRKRRLAKWGSISALLILVSGGMGFGLSHFFGGNDEGNEPNGNPALAQNPPPKKTNDGKVPTNRQSPDPWVLTVAKDGSGQFKTIGAALRRVKPGMIVRVLDDEEYRESVSITSASQHSGITLESTMGATIVGAAQQSVALRISAVKDVTVRGFRLKADGPRLTLVEIDGTAPGLLLANLLFEPGTGTDYDGILLRGLKHKQHDSPAIVQNCVFRRPKIAIGIIGLANDFKMPEMCAGVILRNNSIFNAAANGIKVTGFAKRVHIVENQFRGDAALGAIQFDNLTESADDLLVANNTFFGCSIAFRLWDDKPEKADVRIVNNLILRTTKPDVMFLNSGGSMANASAGDGSAVLKEWRLQCNWRESSRPTGTDIFSKSWIPAGKGSHLSESLPLLPRDVLSADFLRPTAKSKLATEGAGKTDPSLPSYVGALPPEGTPAWDWNRTWRMPPGEHRVLTVSEKPEDGGKYRTINAALKEAKPWDTIRVLDDAVYPQQINLDDRTQHEGISLEAPNGATIELQTDQFHAVLIRNVRHVRVFGFKFHVKGASRREVTSLILAARNCDGLRLADLEIASMHPVSGIILSGAQGIPDDPLVVTRCRIKVGGYGIVVVGKVAKPCRGIRIFENRIAAAKGINFENVFQNIHVSGNLIRDGWMTNIEFRDPLPASRKVLLANNTSFGGAVSLRIWHEDYETIGSSNQVELRNNVFLDAKNGDLVLLRKKAQNAVPVDSRYLTDLWIFSNNFRDMVGEGVAPLIPLSRRDERLTETVFGSKSQENPDYLRPRLGSALATGGAGGDLPTYAGAVPPKGTKPWDWNVTWRSRMMRAKYSSASNSSAKD